MAKQKKPKLIEDEQHKGLYRIKWPNGKLSEDVYNLTRATQFVLEHEEIQNDAYVGK